ncbi:hypothetical protein AQJ27_49835 [Streptomyces olivochromogenes]|nr:hypothetical protein AQJ27_49835 [Streptomyces olivochromogenes]
MSAATGSEAGPSSTTRPSPRCSSSTGHAASGTPSTGLACAADTIRHNRAQPPAVCASSVMRHRASVTWAPPRTGVRRRPLPGAGSAAGATARSTPKTGRMPAAAAAFAKWTVPATVSRSVSASVVIPRSTARCTSVWGSEAP